MGLFSEIRKDRSGDERRYYLPLNITVMSVIALIMVIATCMVVLPMYGVWQQELAGRAELKRAEQNRQIRIQEANAVMESAGLLAQAEVERAKGVAEANEIIGESLRENEAYLRYLWINGLHDGSSEIIYVPTEANLPILEATRRRWDRGE
jgi:hypothetical protein